MDSIINWGVALLIVVGAGWMGAMDYEDQQRAEAHRKETIAAARKNSEQSKRMAAIEQRLKEMTAFDKIGMK